MNAKHHTNSGLSEPANTGASRSEGCYRCGHCHQVVMPTVAQIELAENAPGPDPAIKCPHCHKYAVHWQRPMAARYRTRPQPVSAEHGHELFAGIFRMLAQT
jgi:hypothetical protein